MNHTVNAIALFVLVVIIFQGSYADMWGVEESDMAQPLLCSHVIEEQHCCSLVTVARLLRGTSRTLWQGAHSVTVTVTLPGMRG